MGFYSSFNDASNLFDGFEATTSFDPFQQQSDVDMTGLDSGVDDLEDVSPFETDDEGDETFEDLDDDDVEIGESFDEQSINETDLDFDIEDEGPDIEPDWNPQDQMDAEQDTDATDSSQEDESGTRDSEVDDNTMDQWEEVSADEEIDQWDEIIEDDTISQFEEVDMQEPLYYPDEEDVDDDPTDNAEEEIEYVDHRDDITDDAFDEIEGADQGLLESVAWVDALETFLDLTHQDVSSFHLEVSDGYEITDGYDPPYFEDGTGDLLEIGNFIDDVFVDVFPDPVNDEFSWFDSFSDM